MQPQAQARFPNLRVVRSKPIYLEFNSPTANKGAALKFIAQQYGIAREEILAIGDSQIDISMFEYAGLGVCLENGTSDAKEAAGYVAPSNDNDGVADAIEKYVLQ